MQAKNIKITVGVTLNYFLWGIILIAVAFYLLCVVHFLVAIPLFYFGFLALISIENILIDVENKTLKRYYILYPFKIGKWQSIEGYDRMVLVLSHDVDIVDTDGMCGNETRTIRTRSFDIYLRNRMEEKIPIKEFPQYKYARTFLSKYGSLMNVEMIDLFEESLQRSAARRR